MDKLKKSFKKYGDIFTQIAQKGDWYIYSRTPYKWDRITGEKVDKTPFPYISTHYEIVKPIENKSGLPNGAFRKLSYQYPRESKWGKYGFTVMTLEKAEEKLNKLAG